MWFAFLYSIVFSTNKKKMYYFGFLRFTINTEP